MSSYRDRVNAPPAAGHVRVRVRVEWVKGPPGHVTGAVMLRGGEWEEQGECHWREWRDGVIAAADLAGISAATVRKQANEALKAIGAPVGGRPPGARDTKRRAPRSDKGTSRA